jgi:phage terminase small subunit
MALTAKQERFVAEYLVDGNATRAAKAAGYSEKTAYSIGQRLLKNVEVASALAAAQSERTERTKIDMEYVLSRLAIEAEREDDRSSHSARVAALGQLRQHLEGKGSNDDDVPTLNINISAAAPVGDIRVTRSEG